MKTIDRFEMTVAGKWLLAAGTLALALVLFAIQPILLLDHAAGMSKDFLGHTSFLWWAGLPAPA